MFEEKYRGRKDTMITVELLLLLSWSWVSIGGRKAMVMSVNNEAAFLWTSSECPAHLIERCMKVCRNLTIFTTLISASWCLDCREKLILRKKWFVPGWWQCTSWVSLRKDRKDTEMRSCPLELIKHIYSNLYIPVDLIQHKACAALRAQCVLSRIT